MKKITLRSATLQEGLLFIRPAYQKDDCLNLEWSYPEEVDVPCEQCSICRLRADIHDFERHASEVYTASEYLLRTHCHTLSEALLFGQAYTRPLIH